MKIKDYSDFIEDKGSHYETDVFVCGYSSEDIKIKIIDNTIILVSYCLNSSNNYTKMRSHYEYEMSLPIDSDPEKVKVVNTNGNSFYLIIPKKEQKVVELIFKT